MRRPSKIGLALGSGGARGFAHLGVLQRLAEWKVPIHCIAGTSMGAIMGAVAVSGAVEKVIRWAEALDWAEAASLFAEINIPKYGFFKGTRIDRTLAEFIPLRTYEESPIPFATVATDIRTGEEIVMKSGNLLSGVHASYSIPGVFIPVLHEGRQLVDGGLVNPLPISVCRDLGADAVIAVDINLRSRTVLAHAPGAGNLSILDVMTNALKILENEVTRSTIASQAPDVLIQPAVGHVPTLQFTRAVKCIEFGRRAADEMRPVLEELMR